MLQIIVFLVACMFSWTSFVFGMETLTFDDTFFNNVELWQGISNELPQDNAQLPKNNHLVGLNNTSGTDCFMNASLQCLFNLAGFASTITTISPSGIFENLTRSLIELIQLKNTARSRSISLGYFASHARHHIFQRYGGQEDAGEFINGLLTCMSSSLNNQTKQKIESLITNTLHTKRQCNTCNTTTTQGETDVSMIEAEIPLHGKTLETCIEQFFAPEIMADEEMGFCETCQSKQNSTKQFSLLQPAQHFIVKAKVFMQNTRTQGNFIKNAQPLSFPLRQLSLNQYRYNDVEIECIYNLTGIVMHRGTLKGGHYIAFIKDPSGNWYLCNDSTISWVSEEQIQAIAQEGYYNYNQFDNENFTPYIWFYSRPEANMLEPLQEIIENNRETDHLETNVGNQNRVCSPSDLLEIEEKCNLLKNKMVLLNQIIDFKEFFNLACRGLYHLALEKGMPLSHITVLFQTNNFPLPPQEMREPQLESNAPRISPLLMFHHENDQPQGETNFAIPFVGPSNSGPNQDDRQDMSPPRIVQSIQHQPEIITTPFNNNDTIQTLVTEQPASIELQVEHISPLENAHHENPNQEEIENDDIPDYGAQESDSDERTESVQLPNNGANDVLIDRENSEKKSQEIEERAQKKKVVKRKKSVKKTLRKKTLPKWECKWGTCKKTFKNEDHKTFIKHVNDAHTKKNKTCSWRECTYKNHLFKNDQQFERHMLTHTKEKKFFCEPCKMSFSRADQLTSHEKKSESHKANEQNKFPCEWKKCTHKNKKNFGSAQELYNHTVKDHAQSSTDRKCKIGNCTTKFKRPSEFLRHLKGKCKYYEFSCQYCNKLFIHKIDKDRHEKKH